MDPELDAREVTMKRSVHLATYCTGSRSKRVARGVVFVALEESAENPARRRMYVRKLP